jgi:hypothetical protein
MLRTLFLRELRKSWLAHASLFAAVIGTVTLLEYAFARGGPPSPDDQLQLSNWLLASLVMSGLISGERCFSKTFKEGRYPFLLTLPRPRARIWLAYLGGRLTGALAALPVLLLRWFAAPLSVAMSWPLLISALAVYLVYFLGGAAFALALQKELLVYLLGLPLLTGLILLLSSCAFYGFVPFVVPTLPEYLSDVSCGSLLLALIWAVVAERAFCRGEVHLGRRAAQTITEVGLASATFAGLAVIVFSSTSLAAFRDEWQPYPLNGTNLTVYRGEQPLMRSDVEADFPYPTDTRPVSSDGRFLFIYQQLRERSLFSRIAVVDLKNGRSSSSMERPGIHQISWSASGNVLNVLATNDAPSDCLRSSL